MAANTFGEIFRLTTFGESHGLGIGLIIDGCPSGFPIDENYIQHELNRRKPGQSKIVSQRNEGDVFTIQSGVFEGKTTGTPISIFIANADQRKKDYQHIQSVFRPSHADFTYQEKYGIRDFEGGGRSSARETAARVAAGAIAKGILSTLGIRIFAYVSQVGPIKMDNNRIVDYSQIENNLVRCPDPLVAESMISYIMEIKKAGDTIGGKITCIIENCPVGLGAPVFDKLHADLAKAMMGINAVKGFEIGDGFDAIDKKGSEHNDIFTTDETGKIITKTNHSGGVQGGISNGMPIYFNVAFKPVATIVQRQDTVDHEGNATTTEGRGRHDACVVPRAVPIVEAMAALVIVDHYLRNKVVRL